MRTKTRQAFARAGAFVALTAGTVAGMQALDRTQTQDPATRLTFAAVTLQTRTPTIRPAAPEPQLQTPAYPLTEDERTLIAQVCHFEAGVDGQAGMQAVAEVVLNRLQDGRFGATVTEVCRPGQFNGLYAVGKEPVSDGAFEAVDAIFTDGPTGSTGGAVYFCTTDCSPDRIKHGLRKTSTVGGHDFYTDVVEEEQQ